MYSVKQKELNPNEEFYFVFDIIYPLRIFRVWVRPGDEVGTLMNYEVEFFFDKESQLLRSRNQSQIDSFSFDLFPANSSKYSDRNFPIDISVRIKNLSTQRKNFYVAFVGKGLEEMG